MVGSFSVPLNGSVEQSLNDQSMKLDRQSHFFDYCDGIQWNLPQFFVNFIHKNRISSSDGVKKSYDFDRAAIFLFRYSVIDGFRNIGSEVRVRKRQIVQRLCECLHAMCRWFGDVLKGRAKTYLLFAVQ